ncbi:hypothetical protein MNBD_GAMMA12-2565 [hydrothermal vent metagenome]|uniref:Uncharacterized protein n=1 Tax=hydrothermal vent metagenome TaxID=652676 RepID=A0A3B0Z2K1_9ZZZZ
MGGNVVINKRTAVHAGSQGQVTSPDVCKTPGKCRPQTYNNIAMSSNAGKTAGSVKVNGNPVCHKDSVFTVSSGDEPGGCGGTASGTIKQKAEFISFSDNVFIEGKAAVRQFDMMISNNKNTPPMPLQQPGAGSPPPLNIKGAKESEPSETGYELAVDVLGGGLSILRDMIVIQPDEE